MYYHEGGVKGREISPWSWGIKGNQITIPKPLSDKPVDILLERRTRVTSDLDVHEGAKDLHSMEIALDRITMILQEICPLTIRGGLPAGGRCLLKCNIVQGTGGFRRTPTLSYSVRGIRGGICDIQKIEITSTKDDLDFGTTCMPGELLEPAQDPPSDLPKTEITSASTIPAGWTRGLARTGGRVWGTPQKFSTASGQINDVHGYLMLYHLLGTFRGCTNIGTKPYVLFKYTNLGDSPAPFEVSTVCGSSSTGYTLHSLSAYRIDEMAYNVLNDDGTFKEIGYIRFDAPTNTYVPPKPAVICPPSGIRSVPRSIHTIEAEGVNFLSNEGTYTFENEPIFLYRVADMKPDLPVTKIVDVRGPYETALPDGWHFNMESATKAVARTETNKLWVTQATWEEKSFSFIKFTEPEETQDDSQHLNLRVTFADGRVQTCGGNRWNPRPPQTERIYILGRYLITTYWIWKVPGVNAPEKPGDPDPLKVSKKVTQYSPFVGYTGPSANREDVNSYLRPMTIDDYTDELAAKVIEVMTGLEAVNKGGLKPTFPNINLFPALEPGETLTTEFNVKNITNIKKNVGEVTGGRTDPITGEITGGRITGIDLSTLKIDPTTGALLVNDPRAGTGTEESVPVSELDVGEEGIVVIPGVHMLFQLNGQDYLIPITVRRLTEEESVKIDEPNMTTQYNEFQRDPSVSYGRAPYTSVDGYGSPSDPDSNPTRRRMYPDFEWGFRTPRSRTPFGPNIGGPGENPLCFGGSGIITKGGVLVATIVNGMVERRTQLEIIRDYFFATDPVYTPEELFPGEQDDRYALANPDLRGVSLPVKLRSNQIRPGPPGHLLYDEEGIPGNIPPELDGVSLPTKYFTGPVGNQQPEKVECFLTEKGELYGIILRRVASLRRVRRFEDDADSETGGLSIHGGGVLGASVNFALLDSCQLVQTKDSPIIKTKPNPDDPENPTVTSRTYKFAGVLTAKGFLGVTRFFNDAKDLVQNRLLPDIAEDKPFPNLAKNDAVSTPTTISGSVSDGSDYGKQAKAKKIKIGLAEGAFQNFFTGLYNRPPKDFVSVGGPFLEKPLLSYTDIVRVNEPIDLTTQGEGRRFFNVITGPSQTTPKPYCNFITSADTTIPPIPGNEEGSEDKQGGGTARGNRVNTILLSLEDSYTCDGFTCTVWEFPKFAAAWGVLRLGTAKAAIPEVRLSSLRWNSYNDPMSTGGTEVASVTTDTVITGGVPQPGGISQRVSIPPTILESLRDTDKNAGPSLISGLTSGALTTALSGQTGVFYNPRISLGALVLRMEYSAGAESRLMLNTAVGFRIDHFIRQSMQRAGIYMNDEQVWTRMRSLSGITILFL